MYFFLLEMTFRCDPMTLVRLKELLFQFKHPHRVITVTQPNYPVSLLFHSSFILSDPSDGNLESLYLAKCHKADVVWHWMETKYKFCTVTQYKVNSKGACGKSDGKTRMNYTRRPMFSVSSLQSIFFKFPYNTFLFSVTCLKCLRNKSLIVQIQFKSS